MLFAFVYIFLMIWFGKQSIALFEMLTHGKGNVLFLGVSAFIFLFLSIFMLKSLFLFKKREKIPFKEITKEDEPVLVDYIYKVADEIGAPRPHKIYLSDRVNASVFYDLSILNILFPSKKNLEIGLGLVNVLNIGEFKAILAHEFGHFAQRSMLLGRYVYVAQQIAERVVRKRDILDNGLGILRGIDIRIAWIGWILSIIVWAVRSVTELLFSVVVWAERALSREMEFQADNVSVSVTGSDALINALHKLRAADEGYHAAFAMMNKLAEDKKAAPNLFTLQQNYIEKMRWILDNPEYGLSPKFDHPDGNNRVFKNRIVNPPEMWSTHPADLDREENAKRIYISARIDERSPWKLLKSSQETQKEVTKDLIERTKLELETISNEESIELMNQYFYNWTFLDPKYKGVFLGRHSTISFKNIEDIYLSDSIDLKSAYENLYPESIKEKLEIHKELLEEMNQLNMIQYEPITAENRQIMHRGEEIGRSEIPEILSSLEKEEKSLNQELVDHDRLCRTVALNSAKEINPKVANYLKSLLEIIHYAEHSHNNLIDAFGKYQNTLQVVLADGVLSESEASQLIQAGRDLDDALAPVYNSTRYIELDKTVLAKLDVEAVSDLFEEYKLGSPDSGNLNDWVQNAPSWVDLAIDRLEKIKSAVLEQLLDFEEEVKNVYLNKKTFSLEYGNISVKDQYKTLVPGEERKLQFKLRLWDRFQAGIGLFPSIARFTVAGAIIISAIIIGNVSGKVNVFIQNGFPVPMQVFVDNESYTVLANSHTMVEVSTGDHELQTKAITGELIENFDVTVDDLNNHIYNIGNSSYFYQYWTVYSYSNTDIPPTEYIGCKRWFSSDADYVLKDAPEQIQSRSSNAEYKSSLMPFNEFPPTQIPRIFEDSDKSTQQMISGHVKWGHEKDKWFNMWLGIAARHPGGINMIKERLKHHPMEVSSVRWVLDIGSPDEVKEMSSKIRSAAKRAPENPNLYYLNTRILPDDVEQDSAFLRGTEKWPTNGWLAMASAYVYASQEKWQKALDQFTTVAQELPAFRENIAIDMERIFKRLNADIFEEENKLMRHAMDQSSNIDYYRWLEQDMPTDQTDVTDVAYCFLANGELDKAMNHLKQLNALDQSFLWYIAASSNAPEDVVSKMLEIKPSNSIDLDLLPIVIGFRAKHNQDISELTEALATSLGLKDVTSLNEFIAFVKAGKIGQANKNLKKGGFYIKMMKELIAGIILEKETPHSWRRNINSLVFITEKPYLDF